MSKIGDGPTAVQEQAKAWRLLLTTLEAGEAWETKYRRGTSERVDCATQRAIKQLVDVAWDYRNKPDSLVGAAWFEAIQPALARTRAIIRGSQQRVANERRARNG